MYIDQLSFTDCCVLYGNKKICRKIVTVKNNVSILINCIIHNKRKRFTWCLTKWNLIFLSTEDDIVFGLPPPGSTTGERTLVVVVGVAVGLWTGVFKRLGVWEVWTCLWRIMCSTTAVSGITKGKACALTSYDSTGPVQLHSARTNGVYVGIAASRGAIVWSRRPFGCSSSGAHAHRKIKTINQTDVVKVLISGTVKGDFR